MMMAVMMCIEMSINFIGHTTSKPMGPLNENIKTNIEMPRKTLTGSGMSR